MLRVGIFGMQQVIEWSSNLVTNFFGFSSLDWLFDPVDVIMSGLLAFWFR